MEQKYWHEAWSANQIGFHEGQPNDLLTTYFATLKLQKDARVFVPLCGKTKDIPWLISNGCHVIGAELSETAVRQLFEESGITPTIKTRGPLKHFEADKIDIYVGNIFDLSAKMIGPVDAIFDRAAFVALPADIRKRYAKHLMEITENAPQLLITYNYDQSVQAPPPHSIETTEIEQHYAKTYQINELEVKDVAGGLKGGCAAVERASLLTPK